MVKKYIRKGIVSFEEVYKQRYNKKATFLGEEVNLDSLRLRTFFEKGAVCSSCGMIAKFFAVEKAVNDYQTSRYHLNLYGYTSSGEEDFFTHDHTIARVFGGADSLENCTTMCYTCNQKKAKFEQAVRNVVKNKMKFRKKVTCER